MRYIVAIAPTLAILSGFIAPMAIAPLTVAPAAMAQTLPVRVDRWLEIDQVYGTVFFQRGSQTEPAREGMRLQQVGDTLRTSSRSNAVLRVDTNTGIITVSPNTTIRILEIRTTESGGRVTRLEVTTGQARFQVVPFTNPDSRMEIQTPAGSSAVRGTEFGVGVQPNGVTAVATLDGAVLAEAQGQSVQVDAGFQTLMVPGEPPLPPVETVQDLNLRLILLTTLDDRTARIRADVNPVNLVTVEDVLQTLNSQGEFDILVPLPANRRIVVVVTAPSGQEQTYELAVP